MHHPTTNEKTSALEGGRAHWPIAQTNATIRLSFCPGCRGGIIHKEI